MPKESIFKSSLRAFFISISVLLGFFVVFAIASSALFAPKPISPRPALSEILVYPDEHGKREELGDKAPIILRLNVHGVIGAGNLVAGKFSNLLFDANGELLPEGSVKAVLLDIDSPGGTVDDSFEIYRMVKAFKEELNIPVYAYVHGLCASGGMYIASSADKIYAAPYSVIGSVGVISGTAFNYTGLMKTYGVEAKTLKQGLHKDDLNPFRPWTADEGQERVALLEALYTQFIDTVVAARKKLTAQQLRTELGASVFIAAKAQELGYIDEGDKTYGQTLHDLATAAGITGKYRVIRLKPATNFYENVFGENKAPGGKIDHVIHLGKKVASELQNGALYYYNPDEN